MDKAEVSKMVFTTKERPAQSSTERVTKMTGGFI